MRAPVHLNALRAFEASARHLSFVAAAAELHVTPAAVGQLVRTLEDWLGAALFVRGSGGRARLLTTEMAERALPDIRAGFERLSLGLDKLREGRDNGTLTVTVSPAFAAKWLMPRIDKFQQAWPDLDLRLDTSLKAADFGAQKIDIGVRYGHGEWPGLQAHKLMDEEIYPVCSPKLLALAGLHGPAQLCQATLIHDLSMDGHRDFPSWQDWLSRAGVAAAAVPRGLQINNSAAVLQAACEGQGIALARSVMAHEDVASGRLVRLFPELSFVSPLAYFVVHRAEGAALPHLQAFKTWLCDEARTCHAGWSGRTLAS